NWNGDLAEVIAYNTSLNPAQRIIVANYLAAKYGLSLSSNHVYSQDLNGFDFDVAGIGRVTGASQSQTTSSGPGIVQITGATDLGNDEFLMWGHDNGTLGTWGQGDLPTGIQGRWNRTWRVSERNTANSSSVNVGNVDLGFDLTGFTIGNINDLRLIVDTDGDDNFSEEAVIGPPTLSGGRYWFYGVSTITNADRFTLGTTNMSSTMLPIELVSFEAQAVDASNVHLRWATASEHDNDHFTVERSGDASDWQQVAEVDAIGNSNSLTEYWTNDDGLEPQVYYYRLRQTDIDGTSTLSDVVAINLERYGYEDVLLFPNPSAGSFQVRFAVPPSQEPKFTLLDALGRAVSLDDQGTPGTGVYTMQAGNTADGVYQLHIQVADAVTVRRARITR
ncbi:MAG: hypothetical protein KA175_06040, partial [Flavobacteriales bacterium]|nr:hypothetical protein [Flavobacteriales bacterium]